MQQLFASRTEVALKIVGTSILRHLNLLITQKCLVKVSDIEEIIWIDNIRG